MNAAKRQAYLHELDAAMRPARRDLSADVAAYLAAKPATTVKPRRAYGVGKLKEGRVPSPK